MSARTELFFFFFALCKYKRRREQPKDSSIAFSFCCSLFECSNLGSENRLDHRHSQFHCPKSKILMHMFGVSACAPLAQHFIANGAPGLCPLIALFRPFATAGQCLVYGLHLRIPRNCNTRIFHARTVQGQLCIRLLGHCVGFQFRIDEVPLVEVEEAHLPNDAFAEPLVLFTDCARVEAFVGGVQAIAARLRRAQGPGKVRLDLHGLELAKLGREEALDGNVGDGAGPCTEIRRESGHGRLHESEAVRRAAVPVSDQGDGCEGAETRANSKAHSLTPWGSVRMV